MIRTKLDELKQFLSCPEKRQRLFWFLINLLWRLIWVYGTFFNILTIVFLYGVCGVTGTTGCY